MGAVRSCCLKVLLLLKKKKKIAEERMSSSLSKTAAYQQMEKAVDSDGRGHIFVNPITVKADVHFASAGEESDESDYHTGRSASDDIELVELKSQMVRNGGGRRGGDQENDSGRLLSSNSNYSVSSYNYSDVSTMGDLLFFTNLKLFILFLFLV